MCTNKDDIKQTCQVFIRRYHAFDLTIMAYLKKANKLKAMGQTQRAMEVFAKVTELDPIFRERGKYLFQKSGLVITFCLFQVESCKVCSTIANYVYLLSRYMQSNNRLKPPLPSPIFSRAVCLFLCSMY